MTMESSISAQQKDQNGASASAAEAAIAVSVLLDGIQLEFAMSRAQLQTQPGQITCAQTRLFGKQNGHLFLAK